MFSSPCGAWVVSAGTEGERPTVSRVFVPLRGVGCFSGDGGRKANGQQSFHPLAGCGLFRDKVIVKGFTGMFSSPCGVCIVSEVWVYVYSWNEVFVPLRGVNCFCVLPRMTGMRFAFSSPCGVWIVSRGSMPRSTYPRFRPLAGCELFPKRQKRFFCRGRRFRPLAGCGLFPLLLLVGRLVPSFRPLAGCELFLQANNGEYGYFVTFSSPCGVWIVSAKVHRPSSCSAGKPSLFTNYSIDRSFLQGKSPALTRQIPRGSGAKPEKKISGRRVFSRFAQGSCFRARSPPGLQIEYSAENGQMKVIFYWENSLHILT